MHVSTASVVKFVGMVFPCLCETPVTSCAKQGTKKKKQEKHIEITMLFCVIGGYVKKD